MGGVDYESVGTSVWPEPAGPLSLFTSKEGAGGRLLSSGVREGTSPDDGPPFSLEDRGSYKSSLPHHSRFKGRGRGRAHSPGPAWPHVTSVTANGAKAVA